MAVLPWISNEDIWVPLRSEHPISGVANLLPYPVEVAVTLADPQETDFHDAVWEPAGAWPGPDGLEYYWARLEIGPGSNTVTLADGQTYKVYGRVTTPSNRPVIYSGTILTQ